MNRAPMAQPYPQLLTGATGCCTFTETDGWFGESAEPHDVQYSSCMLF